MTVTEEASDRARDLYYEALGLASRHQSADAWDRISRALELHPGHPWINQLAGELCRDGWESIRGESCSERQGAEEALPYFDRALKTEPRYADAWAGNAYSLVYMEEYEAAWDAARQGISVLRYQQGPGMRRPTVFHLVAEEVYDSGVQALLGLGRLDEARGVLNEGLRITPGSAYLERHRSRLEGIDASGTPREPEPTDV